MFYLIWIVSAFVAVGFGLFGASLVDRYERRKKGQRV
jgi:hypothetical protein